MVLAYVDYSIPQVWNDVAARVKKLCPLTTEEIVALPVVFKKSAYKGPGWRPLTPGHPLEGVRALGFAP